jgi:putative hydrolase of the HAD superfamily
MTQQYLRECFEKRENLVVVFDLDDTLILEKDYVRSGLKAVDQWLSESYAKKYFYEKAWSYFLAGEVKIIDKAIIDLFDSADCDCNALIGKAVLVYRTHLPKISLLRDARILLQLLSKTTRLALITDGRSVAQWNKINVTCLSGVFQKIIVTGDQGELFFKPNPWAYQQVMKEFSEGTEFIYIGDNPKKDFDFPGKNPSWRTSIRVRRKEGLYTNVDTPNDVVEIKSLYEIIVVLK